MKTVIEKAKGMLECDALLVGVGERGPRDEGIKIRRYEIDNLEPNFVAEYPVARDIISRFFAAFPRIVQLISRSDYSKLKAKDESGKSGVRDASAVAKYLAKHDIEHMLLAGMESTFGLAWIVFYRRRGQAFDNDDAEYVRFHVPPLLYDWQKSNLPRSGGGEPPARLLPFTPQEMSVAILALEGKSAKEIALELGMRERAVERNQGDIRKRLDIVGKLTLADLTGRGAGTSTGKEAN